MAYKNDSLLNNTASPMDFLYSRLATLSALQSYAATAGYYMSNSQQQAHSSPISTVPIANEHAPGKSDRLHSVSTQCNLQFSFKIDQIQLIHRIPI